MLVIIISSSSISIIIISELAQGRGERDLCGGDTFLIWPTCLLWGILSTRVCIFTCLSPHTVKNMRLMV